jgi:hypothetical protein
MLSREGMSRGATSSWGPQTFVRSLCPFLSWSLTRSLWRRRRQGLRELGSHVRPPEFDTSLDFSRVPIFLGTLTSDSRAYLTSTSSNSKWQKTTTTKAVRLDNYQFCSSRHINITFGACVWHITLIWRLTYFLAVRAHLSGLCGNGK